MDASPSTTSARWLRKRNFVLLIALLAVGALGWLAIELWRLNTAKPTISVNYREQFRQQSMKLAGVSAEDGERTWTHLIDAVKIVADVQREMKLDPRADGFQSRGHDDDGSIDFTRVLLGRTPPAEIDREHHALQELRNRGFFEQMQRLEASPPGLRPTAPTGPMMAEYMPELAQARRAAMALTASMRLSAIAGDLDECVRNFNAALAVRQTVSLQPGIINGLVAIAIDALIFGELTHLLMEHDLSAAQCEAMLAGIDRHPMAPLAHALDSERTVFLDTVQNFFTDDGHGNGYMLPGEKDAISGAISTGGPEPASLFETLTARFLLADRGEAIETYEYFHQQLLSEAALTPSQRWSGSFDPETFTDSLPTKQFLVRILAPAIRKSVDAWGMNDAQSEGRRLMICLELYSARHGRNPASLAELVPDVIREPSTDPLTGGPWGYKLLEGDADGRPFLLYSFGYDETDDGGAMSSDRPTAISDRYSSGEDYIFNTPRKDE